MKKKSKKKNSADNTLKIVLSIFVILIISLIIFICVSLSRTTPRKAESNYVNKNQYQDEEIKNIDDLTELSTELDQIISMKVSDKYNAKTTYNDFFFKFDILKEEITLLDKQEIVLNTIEWDKITGDKWKNFTKLKEIAEIQQQDNDGGAAYISESFQVTAEKANKLSVDLFGEKIKYPIEEIGVCPTYYLYDTKEKIYYKPSPQCGFGVSFNEILGYKSKFIRNNNTITINMSFAFLACTPEGVCSVYRDFEYGLDEANYPYVNYTDLYKDDQVFFEITEDNYKEFSEYKFTFEQATNGNYYFVDLEQIK